MVVGWSVLYPSSAGARALPAATPPVWTRQASLFVSAGAEFGRVVQPLLPRSRDTDLTLELLHLLPGPASLPGSRCN